MKTRYSPRLIVATVALSLGLAAGAFAMPPGNNDSGNPSMHQMRGHHRGMKEMARLHDDLKLDAKQEALWKDAESSAKDSMTGMRDRFRKHHEEMQTLINQPGADLRVALKRMDDFRAETQKLHDASRERWLKVYDALNAEQKEKARIFFKNMLDHMGRRGRD